MVDRLLPKKAEGLDLHEVKDGFIIYAVGNDRVHHLNPTAALIFELCDGTRDADQVAAAVAQAYDLDAPPVGEVRESIRSLLEEEVLRA